MPHADCCLRKYDSCRQENDRWDLQIHSPLLSTVNRFASENIVRGFTEISSRQVNVWRLIGAYLTFCAVRENVTRYRMYESTMMNREFDFSTLARISLNKNLYLEVFWDRFVDLLYSILIFKFTLSAMAAARKMCQLKGKMSF